MCLPSSLIIQENTAKNTGFKFSHLNIAHRFFTKFDNADFINIYDCHFLVDAVCGFLVDNNLVGFDCITRSSFSADCFLPDPKRQVWLTKIL
jgi:hypothetical protein